VKYGYLLLLLFSLVLFPSIHTFSQVNLGQTDRWMKGALAAMERKDYQTANSIFRNLIDSGLPLPDEMPYYFSETLFELGQYDNSNNFLNKYLELTGFKGQNYQGASELKEKLKGPLAKILACELCELHLRRKKTNRAILQLLQVERNRRLQQMRCIRNDQKSQRIQHSGIF